MRKPIKGFTYIELIIVIVILGILYLVISPGLILRSTFNLHSITEQIREDIQYTQILSMMAGNPENGSSGNYSFRVVSSTSYQIAPATGAYPSLPAGPSNRFIAEGLPATVTLPNGVTLSASANPIYFNSNGFPVDATGSPIATQTVTITAGGSSNILKICAITGFITTGSCS